MEVQRDRLGRPLNRAQLPEFRRGVEPPNKGKRYPAEPLARDEIDALISACGRGRRSVRAQIIYASVRNRTEILLGYKTGLRDMELRTLGPRDVNLDAGELRVREGKGRKPRVLGFDGEVAEALERWQGVRELIEVPPGRPLFCTVTPGNIGSPLSESYMRNTMPELGRQAGIEKRVHMHALRHTWAYERLRENWPLDLISAGLGHSRLTTTERYVRHLRPAELVDAMRFGYAPAAGGQVVDLLTVLSEREDLAAQFAQALVALSDRGGALVGEAA